MAWKQLGQKIRRAGYDHHGAPDVLGQFGISVDFKVSAPLQSEALLQFEQPPLVLLLRRLFEPQPQPVPLLLPHVQLPPLRGQPRHVPIKLQPLAALALVPSPSVRPACLCCCRHCE